MPEARPSSVKEETGAAAGGARKRSRLTRRVVRAVVAVLVLWLAVVGWMAHDRGLDVWGPGYVQWALSRPSSRPRPVNIAFVIADHFEPGAHSEILEEWQGKWPQLALKHADSSGRPPQYTWFYPIEQYREEQVDVLRKLCDRGLGEIQVHLHHSGDTATSLRQKLREGKEHLFADASCGSAAGSSFVFIHGNWALDNSRREHGRDMCGVDSEISVLREEGCVADMTFPTLVRQAQPKTVNRIYYAIDDPRRPKSYDTGIRAAVGSTDESTGLLMIPGPLLVNWREWHAFHPTIEDGCIQGNNPPSPQRVDSWVAAGVGVKGAENWVFVKVHLHGATKDTRPVVLGKPMDDMFSYLERHYNDGQHYVLHYLRASEAVAVVHALERGDGDALSAATGQAK